VVSQAIGFYKYDFLDYKVEDRSELIVEIFLFIDNLIEKRD